MVDSLWPGGPRFMDAGGVYRVGADSVLLAYFAGRSNQKKRARAIDLGCGCGIISILLAWRDAGLRVDGVDIQPDAVRCATENAALSGLSDRINFIGGDIRNHRRFLQSGIYDITVANPPYYAPGSGKRSADASRSIARCEELCSLDDICVAASYLTRWGGSFSLVHKTRRLADIFRALDKSGFEPKRIRFVHNKSSSPPNLVLIESRRGGKPSLYTEAPLILKNDDGSDTEELKLAYGAGRLPRPEYERQ